MSDSSWPWRQLHTWRWQRGWCVYTVFYFGFSAFVDSCLSRETSVMASRSKHWWNVLLKTQRGFDVHTFTMQRQDMLLQCVIALSSRTNFLKMEKRSRANPSSLCRLCVFQCISATSAQSTEQSWTFWAQTDAVNIRFSCQSIRIRHWGPGPHASCHLPTFTPLLYVLFFKLNINLLTSEKVQLTTSVCHNQLMYYFVLINVVS